MNQFRYIESVFRERCQKWGYEEVRTPTLEYLHLFTSTGTLTPSRLGKVYSFLDWDGWSGERIVLRPDGTIPVARLYIDSMKGQELARLFYVTNVFSYEQTGAKTREKWQCGAELMGSDSWIADVELMLLALEILQIMSLANIKLKLSHAGVIKAYLACLGIDSEEQGKLFDQILDGNTGALDNIKLNKSELSGSLPSLLILKPDRI
jgi:histidyl-tRNA synthetase